MTPSRPSPGCKDTYVGKCSVDISLLRQIFFEFYFQTIFSNSMLVSRIKRTSSEHKLIIAFKTSKAEDKDTHHCNTTGCFFH